MWQKNTFTHLPSTDSEKSDVKQRFADAAIVNYER